MAGDNVGGTGFAVAAPGGVGRDEGAPLLPPVVLVGWIGSGDAAAADVVILPPFVPVPVGATSAGGGTACTWRPLASPPMAKLAAALGDIIGVIDSLPADAAEDAAADNTLPSLAGSAKARSTRSFSFSLLSRQYCAMAMASLRPPSRGSAAASCNNQSHILTTLSKVASRVPWNIPVGASVTAIVSASPMRIFAFSALGSGCSDDNTAAMSRTVDSAATTSRSVASALSYINLLDAPLPLEISAATIGSAKWSRLTAGITAFEDLAPIVEGFVCCPKKEGSAAAGEAAVTRTEGSGDSPSAPDCPLPRMASKALPTCWQMTPKVSTASFATCDRGDSMASSTPVTAGCNLSNSSSDPSVPPWDRTRLSISNPSCCCCQSPAPEEAPAPTVCWLLSWAMTFATVADVIATGAAAFLTAGLGAPEDVTVGAPDELRLRPVKGGFPDGVVSPAGPLPPATARRPVMGGCRDEFPPPGPPPPPVEP